jgi:hypothetical protein
MGKGSEGNRHRERDREEQIEGKRQRGETAGKRQTGESEGKR